MAAPPPPPPRRTASPATSSKSTPSAPAVEPEATWKSKMKAKGSIWGKKAVEKGTVWSDNIGGRVNDIAEKKFGTEHFWPVTGDFVREMDKCARILRAFTVEGIVKEEVVEEKDTSGTGKKEKKKAKVLRKIPPEVIRQAKGVAIFTSMRTGFAPFGGAGGAGLVIAKLPDGSWSAPSSITPNNLSAGFLIGVDVYDCVLIIRSQEAMDSFSTHKVTLGAEIGVAAGPYGTGAAVEAGKEKAPVFSYIKSRGLYAGVEIVGQVFVERYEENAAQYHWPGVKAGDILAGKVRVPLEAAALHSALRDAETGKAQAEKGEPLDMLINTTSAPLDPNTTAKADLQLKEGEVMKLPPTPDMTDGTEYQSDPETEKVRPLSHQGVSPFGDHKAVAGAGAGTATGSSMLEGQGLGVPSRTASGGVPKLPPRPVFTSQHSSQSHYSDALDETEELPPPGYDAPPYAEEPGVGSGSGVGVAGLGLGHDGQGGHGYPADVKKTAVELEREQAVQGMTEAERAEWEQHWREEDDEALRKALESSKLDSTGGTGGNSRLPEGTI